jgi:hypothetical protein
MTFRLIDVNGIQFVGFEMTRAESKSNLADHISYARRVCVRESLSASGKIQSIEVFDR